MPIIVRILRRSTLVILCVAIPHAFAQVALQVPANPAASGPANRPPTVTAKDGKDHLLKKVSVSFPPIAAAAHVSGVVAVGAEIDQNGNVTKVVPLNGPELLRSAALDAVKQYKYRPFIVDGMPTVVRTAVQVFFLPFHAKSD